MFPPTMLVPSLLSLLLLLGTASSEKLSGADALLGLMDIVFTRETCERTFCVPVQQCQDGFIDDSGCCPICRHILREGESCWSTAMSFDGVHTARCGEGLSCKLGVCTRDIKHDRNNEPCETKRKRRLLLKEKGLIAQEAWVPECDTRGGYVARQCKSNKCVCVSEAGQNIFGQSELDRAENMTCGCSREMTARKQENLSDWMAKPQLHCDSHGDYEKLQCNGDVCYCADPKSGKPLGQLVFRQQFHLLPCYDSERYSKGYLSSCEKEMTRVRSLVYHFQKKGQHLAGLENSAHGCDLDGGFSRVQCGCTDSSCGGCVCANSKGVSLKSYSQERKDFKEGMTCDCAFDEDHRLRNFASLPLWSCNRYGNFEPLQWLSERYYCVEKDGSVLQSFLAAPEKVKQDDYYNMLRENCTATDVDIYCGHSISEGDSVCEREDVKPRRSLQNPDVF